MIQKKKNFCRLTYSPKNFLKKGHKNYRTWAAKSDLPGYIKCIWCGSEFKVKYTTGNDGHEKTHQHMENVKKQKTDKKFDSKIE